MISPITRTFFGLLVAAPLVFLVVRGEDASKSSDIETKLHKLLDYDNYKRLFDKSYELTTEDAARKRLFFARATRALISGIKYKLNLANSYNSLNPFSDMTQKELDRMRNKIQDESSSFLQVKSGRSSSKSDDWLELPELLPREGEPVEQELKEILERFKDKPGLTEFLAAPKKRARRKREAKNQPKLRHSFSMDNLINLDQNSEPVPRKPLKLDPKSNNDKYEQLEHISFGIDNQYEVVNILEEPEVFDPRAYSEQLNKAMKEIWRKQMESQYTDEPAPDDVFVDHRSSGCFSQPRYQGSCGSCYAFAGIAMIEYHLCKKTGHQWELSEQYIVDCGRFDKSQRLYGCGGGFHGGFIEFVHNFGLELRRSYPYSASQSTCPVREDADLEEAGYIRLALVNSVSIHQRRWVEALHSGPLYVVIRSGRAFHEYGGGVDPSHNCDDKTHAMVLVGHGRQDGQEYWLLRNSYGTKWGESGYWKLAKKATKRCMETLATAIGTRDGATYDIDPYTIKMT